MMWLRRGNIYINPKRLLTQKLMKTSFFYQNLAKMCKNTEKGDLDQQLEFTAPKHLSKYATGFLSPIEYLNVIPQSPFGINWWVYHSACSQKVYWDGSHYISCICKVIFIKNFNWFHKNMVLKTAQCPTNDFNFHWIDLD